MIREHLKYSQCEKKQTILAELSRYITEHAAKRLGSISNFHKVKKHTILAERSRYITEHAAK